MFGYSSNVKYDLLLKKSGISLDVCDGDDKSSFKAESSRGQSYFLSDIIKTE